LLLDSSGSGGGSVACDVVFFVGAFVCGIDSALDETVDLSVAGSDDGAVPVGDGWVGVDKVHVVQDKRAGSRGSAVSTERSDDTEFSISDDGVQQNDRSGRGDVTALAHVKAHAAVVDLDVFLEEDPVPVLKDGRVASVERHVDNSELLVSRKKPNGTIIEDQVFEPPS
jgi:hypothetical protein